MAEAEELSAEEMKADGGDEKEEMSNDQHTEPFAEDVMARRTSDAMRKRFSVQRFDRKDLTVFVCLRGSTNYIVSRVGADFTASATDCALKYALAMVPHTEHDDIYHLIHVQSGQYLSVRTLDWTLCAVPHEELGAIDPELLRFTIVDVASETKADSFRLRIRISWQDRHLTLSRNRGLLSFTDGAEAVADEARIFTMERPKAHKTDCGLEIIPLMDLVTTPRPEKCQIRAFPKVKNVKMDLFEIIKAIFVRLNKHNPSEQKHYAPFVRFWSEFSIYSKGMVSQTVMRAFEEGVNKRLLGTGGAKLLVHITDFVHALDTVTYFYANDIKLELEQREKERKALAAMSMKIHLERLDEIILTQHPKLKRWRKMNSFSRTLYDWNLWLSFKWEGSDTDTARWVMTRTLLRIQSNYGQSIYTVFSLKRWLVILNTVSALLLLPLVLRHSAEFSWGSRSFTEYIAMFLGSEYEYSCWFYGGFQPSSPGSAMSVGFLYIMSCAAILLLAICSLLRVLVTFRGVGVELHGLEFARKTYSGFDHGVGSEDSMTLQQNSIAVHLHETLLEKKESEKAEVTRILILRRVLGVFLCLCCGSAGFLAIAYLVTKEKKEILPHIERNKDRAGWSVLFYVAEFIVPAAVALLKFVTPFVVRRIVLLERYTARFRSQQIFLRVYLIRVANLMFVFYYMERTARKNQEETCVETQLGMTMYRFIEFNIFLDAATDLVIPNIRYAFTPNGCLRCLGSTKERISRYVQDVRLSALYNSGNSPRFQAQRMSPESSESAIEHELAGDSWKTEFDLPGVLVETIYRQVIVWCGFYFSPMIVPLAAVNSIFSFYSKTLYLRQFCSRPKKPYGLAQNKKVFYGMMLLGVCCSSLAFRYLMGRTPLCGPHQGVNVEAATSEELARELPHWFKAPMEQFFDPIALALLIIMMCAYINYVKGINRAHKDGEKFYKLQLEKTKDLHIAYNTGS